jgi:hypothetical protein
LKISLKSFFLKKSVFTISLGINLVVLFILTLAITGVGIFFVFFLFFLELAIHVRWIMAIHTYDMFIEQKIQEEALRQSMAVNSHMANMTKGGI